MAKKIQEGFHTITPSVVVDDGNKAIEFYKKAFGAEEKMRMPGPGGRGIMHAELKIGDSIFFLVDAICTMGKSKSPKTLGATHGGFYLSVEDVDAVFKKAVDAGATVDMPVQNMFWGDRFGSVTDPFGHSWGISTHVEDVSPEEMKKRGEAFFASMAAK